jgi:hypothetical protein
LGNAVPREPVPNGALAAYRERNSPSAMGVTNACSAPE